MDCPIKSEISEVPVRPGPGSTWVFPDPRAFGTVSVGGGEPPGERKGDMGRPPDGLSLLMLASHCYIDHILRLC